MISSSRVCTWRGGSPPGKPSTSAINTLLFFAISGATTVKITPGNARRVSVDANVSKLVVVMIVLFIIFIKAKQNNHS
jgi:hypothetical protein